MSDKLSLIGSKNNLELIQKMVSDAKLKKGSIIFLSGEAGFGKTHILQYLMQEYSDKNAGIIPVYTECQAPVGKFRVGNFQPLNPFSKALDYILEKKYISAEMRLAKNLGLSLLASLPLTDYIFYAVKEIEKDIKSYKQEKTQANIANTENAIFDYYGAFKKFMEKSPMLLLMDDMQWCDAQSVELLNLFLENIEEIPAVIIIAYKPSLADNRAMPIYNFLRDKSRNHISVKHTELTVLNKTEIGKMTALFFDNYKSNDEFEEWLHEHSFGVPGIAAEYLRYFKQYSPFNSDGSLVTNFKGNEFLPSTVQTVFAQHLETLTDEERNTLSICAVEGVEFTALVVSKLLNVDVLTAIKKLRALQQRTNMIKSQGAEIRYGVKTTVYRFTQGFYQTFFENTLEYEEYVSLHGQIANFLKELFYNAQTEEEKQNIAPYLAAHSAESGDAETVKNMLLVAAETAKRYGSAELAQHMIEQYDALTGLSAVQLTEEQNRQKMRQIIDEMTGIIHPNDENSQQNNGAGDPQSDQIVDYGLVDFKMIRRAVANDYQHGKYSAMVEKIRKYIEDNDVVASEKSQLLIFEARAFTEAGDIKVAEEILNEAKELAEIHNDPSVLCLLYIAYANLDFARDEYVHSYGWLERAAIKSEQLPIELKLLTVINISAVYKRISPDKAGKYEQAARKMAESLNLKGLLSDF